MNILLDRCAGQTRLLSELVELWRQDHQDAKTQELNELITFLVEHSALLGRAIERLTAMLFDEQLDGDVHRIAKLLRRDVDVSLNSLRVLRPAVVALEENSHRIQLGKLDESLTLLETSKRQLQWEWPTIDYAMLAESEAANSKHAYQAAEDFLNELQGLP